MTHQELTRDDHTGFRSPCPGELVSVGVHTDTVFSAAPPTTRTVTRWQCDGCRHFLSSTDAGVVLNCYPPAPDRPAAARVAIEGGASVAIL